MATVVTSDSQFLSLLGINIMLNVVNLLVAGMLYGVYVILFCVAMVILCRREDNNKARTGLLLAVMTMFTLTSFCFWSDMTIFMAGIQDDFVNDVEQPLPNKHAVYAQKFRLVSSVVEVIIPVEIIIGDAIVFWRAWVFCDVNRKIVYIPLLLLVGTTCARSRFWDALRGTIGPSSNRIHATHLRFPPLVSRWPQTLLGQLPSAIRSGSIVKPLRDI